MGLEDLARYAEEHLPHDGLTLHDAGTLGAGAGCIRQLAASSCLEAEGCSPSSPVLCTSCCVPSFWTNRRAPALIRLMASPLLACGRAHSFQSWPRRGGGVLEELILRDRRGANRPSVSKMRLWPLKRARHVLREAQVHTVSV